MLDMDTREDEALEKTKIFMRNIIIKNGILEPSDANELVMIIIKLIPLVIHHEKEKLKTLNKKDLKAVGNLFGSKLGVKIIARIVSTFLTFVEKE